MSSMSSLSDLAMVTAMVLYLASFIAHAAEWGLARSATATVSRRSRGRRRLQPVGAGVVAPAIGARNTANGDTPAKNADDGDDRNDSPEGDVGDSEPAGAVPERRIEQVGRIGVAIAIIGTACNLVGVVLRGIAADRPPWANMYEFMISSVAMVMVAHLVLVIRFRMRWLGMPTLLICAMGIGLAVTVFYVAVADMVPALDSVWFIIHISTAALSGAAFNIGAVVALMYLIRSHMEKRGRVHGYFAKMPTAATLDAISYRLHAFAFPLWTFTVAAGAVWAQYAWGRFWGWDPKETWALVTWIAYACYLHARLTAGWKGGKAAIIALVGVATFWFNFVGVNLLFSGLHSYAGL